MRFEVLVNLIAQMDIDTEAYRLATLIQTKTISPGQAKSEADHVIYGIPKIADLGEVESFQTETQDIWGSVNSRSLNEGGVSIGFGAENYKIIKSIAASFLDEEHRSEFADQEFIEKEIFQWAIDIYKTKRSSMNLTSYLEKRIDEELRAYTYYFKLAPLGIDQAFDFGLIKIFPFTQEYLLADYNTRMPENKSAWENHKESFKPVLGSIVAEITVKAVRQKAEFIAKEEAALTVNALKCFFFPESIAGHYQLFDLDFRSTEVFFTKFITKDNIDGRMKITMQRLNGSIPVLIDNTTIERLKKDGMDTMHNFLVHRKDDELHLLILRGIKQLGELISTRNLHERIVQLISYFELFLNDENNSRSKAQTYLKNQVLPVLVNPTDLDAFKLKVRRVYEVRDKYLHNRISNAVDIEELCHVQNVAFAFLKLVIKLNTSLRTKKELFAHFNISS